MARARPSPFTAVLLFVLTAVVVPAATDIARGAVPERLAPYLWLAWPVAAVSAAAAAVLELRRRRQDAEPDQPWSTGPARPERLHHAMEALAHTVQRQWTAEALLRTVHRPRPLRVRWSSTGRPVAAPAAAVLGELVPGGRPVRLRLRGGVEDIVEKFVRLPKRQLVLLGAPGAGKTVLAVLLTLGLLEHRREHGGPVPVLLSLSSWDPRTEHLHSWVIRRLVQDYPALANSEVFGARAAFRLVTEGHVVPVLDGLDELPVGLHAAAIDALDRTASGSPLVVTCRSDEYEAAVTAGGTVLTTAAVVELEPVGVPEVIEFLAARSAAAEDRWEPVVAHLRACGDGPLARVLSSPLMAGLARAVYTVPANDPAELLDSGRFPDRAALEEHLLDAFIPTAYTPHPPPPDAEDRPGGDPPLYPPHLAHRWLSFLAGDLHLHRTRDLAWWQLHRSFPRSGRRVVGIVLELLTGVVAGLGLAVGLDRSVGVMAGVVGGFSAGLVATAPAHPGYANLALRGRLRLLVRKVAQGLTLGLLMGVGAALALVLARGAGLAVAEDLGLTLEIACVAGAGVGVAFAVMMWLNAPADAIRSPSPQAALRGDRSISGVRLVVESLGSGLLAGLATGRHGLGMEIGFIWCVAAGFGGGLTLGVAGRFTGRFQTGLAASSWGWFLISRSWLALRGRLPWRLMRFLDDAHRRGVLRQTGAVYQFRHARLQDRLAAAGPDGPPP